MNSVMRSVVALISGCLFGTGLAVSGMVESQNVIGFLNVAGDWNGSLMIVMVMALGVTSVGFAMSTILHTPLLAESFLCPRKNTIDKRLIVGAIVFGIGWGVGGWCPGPAISSLSYGDSDAVLFVCAMLLGMWIVDRVEGRIG
ncbi:hypothetical protein A9Q99_00990 [Gammaproteobacteria bacterium 45_16_T64]|nr:hypothetical protein A9Q99_00990 [Gammaproteobacteria bacterium 45_16_T64]